MGCAETKQVYPNSKKKLFTKEGDLPVWLRAQIIDSFKKNDLFLIRRIFNENQINPGCVLYSGNDGWNCFHECCRRNCPDVLEFLIEFGHGIQPDRLEATLNRKDKDGLTPVMVCCQNDCYKNLELLLRFSIVNVDDKNKEGKTAEDLADHRSEQCKKLLDARSQKQIKPESYETAMQKYLRNKFRHNDKNTMDSTSLESTNEPRSDTKYHSRVERIKTMLSQVNENFNIYTILANMNDEDQVFNDEEFLPVLTNITDTPDEDPLLEIFRKAKWRRPNEIYEKEHTILKLYDRVAPDDLELGCDPTSSFSIALQILSEFPTRLIQSIINKEVNRHGVYSCKYYVMGLAAEIYTDDLYPCNEKGEPLFLHTKNQELWPMVMEKSAAKFYGCYRNTQDGLLDDLFEDILGVPCSNYDLKKYKVEKIYEIVLDFHKQNFIMALSSLHEKRGPKGDYKIQNGHYVIDVYEEQGMRMIKLRAPNGKLKGKRLQDHVPPKSEKDKIFVALPNENAFIIKIDDVPIYFDVMSVAFYQESWHKNYISIKSSKNHAEYISLNVMAPTKISIVANQESVKLSEDPDYAYSDIQILMAKDNQDTLTQIGSGDKGSFFAGKTLHIDQKKIITLDAGRYIIRAKTPWRTKDQADFLITTYSDEEVFLDYLVRSEHSEFLEKFYKDEGRHNADKYEMGKECTFASGWEGNHLWLYMQNSSADKNWELEINFKKMENIRLMKRYQMEENVFKAVIPPKSERIAILKRDSAEKAVIDWSFKNNWV